MMVNQRGASGLGVPAHVTGQSKGRVTGYRISPFGKVLHFNVKHTDVGFKIGSGTGTARFYFKDTQ